jgi:NAD(P)-dependent dehydrogenase (short-subunit alcohol dehydrogenase family)
LVTGATSGIGRVACLACAATGATVVFVGRNAAKCKDLLSEIEAAGNNHCEYIVADLSIQAQVRGVAEQFLAKHDRLDLLLNNAGALFTDRGETQDGIEQTWALNHLAYFLLTCLLIDTLKASAPDRHVRLLPLQAGQYHVYPRPGSPAQVSPLRVFTPGTRAVILDETTVRFPVFCSGWAAHLPRT